MVKQGFCIIIGPEPTVILGRDFLEKFGITTFDWQQHRVRLGSQWITIHAKVRGDNVLSRARTFQALALEFTSDSSKKQWRINKGLTYEQQRTVNYLLESYSDVFAVNPEAPSITPTAEHAIDTGSARPIKARGIRMSLNAEEEVHTQRNKCCRMALLDHRLHLGQPESYESKRKINPCGLLSIIGG